MLFQTLLNLNKNVPFRFFLSIILTCFLQPLFSQSSDNFLESMLDVSIRFDTTSLTEVIHPDGEETWKEWKVVDNFAFGKDRGGLPMIADLSSLHPFFRDKIVQLINNCKKKGIELAVVESYRTKAKQAEYYSMGKKYTRTKGGKSKHQYGLAVDLVPLVNGQPKWDDKVLWRRIGVVGENLGLRWGGRWKSIYDPAHFEWTGGLSTSHLENGLHPPIPKPNHYPCIDEDLEQLKKNWDAWEAEQSSLARKN